jgi:hypothetical protein
VFIHRWAQPYNEEHNIGLPLYLFLHSHRMYIAIFSFLYFFFLSLSVCCLPLFIIKIFQHSVIFYDIRRMYSTNIEPPMVSRLMRLFLAKNLFYEFWLLSTFCVLKFLVPSTGHLQHCIQLLCFSLGTLLFWLGYGLRDWLQRLFSVSWLLYIFS